MGIEDYVCTVEQSKKFIELGVKKRSCLIWYKYESDYELLLPKQVLSVDRSLRNDFYIEKIPAYTLQDLFEIMSDLDYEHGYEMRQELLDEFSYSKEIYDPKFVADHIINHIECQRELADGECENDKNS